MNKIFIPYIKWLICTISVALIVTSCTEDMDLELEDTAPRLVVDGRISTNKQAHFVRLTSSGDYFKNEEARAISNAQVSIENDESTITLIEHDDFPGYYFTPDDYQGQVGVTYKLYISDVDIDKDGKKEEYEASSLLNPVAPLDSVRLEYDELYEFWKVLLYAQDPIDTKDFYSFSIAINDSTISDRYSKLGFVDDKFFDGNYANGVWVYTLGEEDDDIELKDGDWVRLTMGGINEDFYKFLEAIEIETGFKAPLFSGPPANVPSNISNGALGFFTAYSTSVDSVQFESIK